MKFSLTYHLSIILAITGILTCHSQAPEFQRKTYTTENGLPHDLIYSIAQDTTGFLWLATWDGLSRFDGNEFRNYRHTPGDPGSLPFFIPAKVVADRQNNVWVLTRFFPVFVYNRAGDDFRHAFEGTYRDAKASDLALDNSGNIWISLDSVLLKHDPATSRTAVCRIISDDSFINTNQGYAQIAVDKTGILWLLFGGITDMAVCKGTVQGDTVIIRFAGSLSLRDHASISLRNDLLNAEIYYSTTGATLLACKYGLFTCDTAKRKFVPVNRIKPDLFQKGQSICLTDEHHGIFVLNTDDGSLINLPVRGSDYTECVYTDGTGTVWSGNINGTRENLGLNRYTRVPSWFSHYQTGMNEDSSVNIVFPVLKDRNGDLWIGTRYQYHLHRIRADGTDTRFILPPDKTGSKSPLVRCMAEDEGGIWFGTTDGRLFYFEFLSQQTTQVYPVPGSGTPVISGIHNILADGSSLIINGSESIYRLDRSSLSLQPGYRHNPAGTGFSLVMDGHRGFWLGTWGSRVIHLDSILQKTGEFAVGEGGNIVEHICPGDSGDIWVALMGGGLGHLYPATGKTEILTTADGLSNNITYSILRDRIGCLWISTNLGISMYNPGTGIFRNYGKTEGLMITEFDSDSFFRTSAGEMFFGGIGGVVGFFPDSIAANMRKNDRKYLTISDLKVSGEGYRMINAPYQTDTFRLRKGVNNFQATMTLFDFAAPEKVRYRYRLSGKDNDWIVTDHRNPLISYANLTHKDYRLELEATNELGEWAFRKAILIRIPHRFLEHPLVRVALVLLFMAPLLFAVKFYMKQQRLKEQQKLDRLRLESLRSQMNPHFIFNSLSSINYFIAKEDRLAANEYIADFSRLIRSVIENSVDDFIPLEKELKSLEDYLKLEHLRIGDRFSYSLSAEKIKSPGEIKVFQGMIQPFVENAIWHGVRNLEERQGHVTIEIIQTGPERLQCIVEDDGVGRKRASMLKTRANDHRSRGIDLVRERLRVFNALSKGDLKVVFDDIFPDREETGTRVIIDLPSIRLEES